MLNDLINGYNSQIDQIAALFTGKAPRLKVEQQRPASDLQFAAYHEKLRGIFARHTPRIEIGDYLGSGGFADVFLATSDYDGVTDFVIKVLKPSLLKKRSGKHVHPDEEEMRIKDLKKRFTNESYVQWALSNSLIEAVGRSVVKVYDHGAFDAKSEYRFILMERLGSTLRNYIDRAKGRFDDRASLCFKAALIARIADVIRSVHIEGIIHRDIKPENILFTATSGPIEDLHREDTGDLPDRLAVKVGDFGTVRWMRSYTSRYDAIIIGSQFYMSPEQIFTPGQIDTRTDIYSFGVVAYEVLFCAHPKCLDDTTVSNQLVKLAHRRPTPRTAPDGFDPLYRIILRCMAPLHERYQTMHEVVSELRNFYTSLHA